MGKLLTFLAVAIATFLPLRAHAGFGTNGTSCNQASLSAAIAALPNGGVIHVSGNNLVSGTTVIPASISLVGAATNCVSSATAEGVINAAGPGIVFDIGVGDSLLVNRVSVHAVPGVGSESVIEVGSGAILWVYDAQIDGGEALQGGCIDANAGSTVVLGEGAIVEDCSADDGGGVYVDAGAQLFALAGSIIRDNVASDGGGGVSIEGGTATISGEVSHNTADYGGGISVRNVDDAASLTLDGDAEVTENIADFAGGGIFVGRPDAGLPAPSALLEENARVAWNDSSGTGGGIHAQGDEVAVTVIDDVVIELNTALADGGGILIRRGDLQVGGRAYVQDNDAAGGGGGIRAETESTVLVEEGARLEYNSAEGDGGGISAVGNSRVDVLAHAWIHRNVAGGDGGGIAMDGSPGSIVGTPLDAAADYIVFEHNVAAGELGGGLALENGALGFLVQDVVVGRNQALNGDGGGIGVRGADLVMENVYAASNRAARGGGVAALQGAVVELSNECSYACSQGLACTKFLMNHAEGGDVAAVGGGIYVAGGASVIVKRLVLEDNEAEDGHAVYVTGATSSLRLYNAIVDGDEWNFVPGSAIEIADGDADLRHCTLVENDQAVHYAAAATGLFHRNVTAENATANVFDAAISGNCNLAPTSAENPTGSNNATGTPTFGACWAPAVGETLIVDACSTGLPLDILGVARPVGAGYDRGAFELQ